MKLALALSVMLISASAQARVVCSATFEPGSRTITLAFNETLGSHMGSLNEYDIMAVSTRKLAQVEIIDRESGIRASSGPMRVSEHPYFTKLIMKNTKKGQSVKVDCSESQEAL